MAAKTLQENSLLRFHDGTFRLFSVHVGLRGIEGALLVYRVRIDSEPLRRLREKGLEHDVDVTTLRPATPEEIEAYSRIKSWPFEVI